MIMDIKSPQILGVSRPALSGGGGVGWCKGRRGRRFWEGVILCQSDEWFSEVSSAFYAWLTPNVIPFPLSNTFEGEGGG